MQGGDRIAEVLKAQGVKFLFTLCGGHISPILVGAKKLGIRVVDVRHEANAVFAADAVARMSGVPGVAAVTAGPGATNTITAIKNAQLAQSPVVLLGGAAATVLRGRGSLQDIDQRALFAPHVKKVFSARRVRDLGPFVEQAFELSREGVPGPVFVECPIDLLYEEALVREWYGAKSDGKAGRSAMDRLQSWYLRRHVSKIFAGPFAPAAAPSVPGVQGPSQSKVASAAERLRKAERPMLLVGSGAMSEPAEAALLAAAIGQLGVPVYLSGTARGLLGAKHPLQRRHKRREALREADVVLLAGVPCDFRLDYGRHIRRGTFLISSHRSRADLKRNRRPSLAAPGDPGRFVRAIAEARPGGDWAAWRTTLEARDAQREAEIDAMAKEPSEGLNPVALCRAMESALAPDSIVVADGGDFVATASYTLAPRSPLSWLDPGVFGTLGVGAGFALGAKLLRPESEVWIVYGDGSVGYSLTEFDSFTQHKIPVIAVVGNDASWMQIARDQVDILKDDVGTVLRRTDYHAAAEALGGKGLLLDDPSKTAEVLARAKELARAGHAVLVNAQLGRTEFRKGSISM